MGSLLNILAVVCALVGGITLFTALFTPKRFRAKRPARFLAGFGLLALSAAMFAFGGQAG